MNCASLKGILNIGLIYVFKLLPVIKKRIYFCSFHGQYSDSPRRVSESISQSLEGAEIIWEITDKCKELLPSYIKKVKPNTVSALYCRSTSQVVVDNYMGWGYGYAPKNSFKYRVLSNQKKKGQFNICTWHGTPLKRIGLDQPENVGKDVDFYSTADLLTANSELMEKLYNHINQNKIPIALNGTPRNDILFMEDELFKKKLREKLKLPKDKKLILFAPTFRVDDLHMSGLYQIDHLGIPKLLDSLSKKFGGEWEFVFRAHDSIIKSINNEARQYSDIVLSGNIGDDMGEYLATCDILLTDYSSSLFDFMFTKRPCFLYCPDYEHYGSVERGFYFSPNELPYPTVITEEALYKTIEEYDEKTAREKIDRFLNRIGSVEDGKSTEKIVNRLLDYINENNQYLRKS